MSVLHFDIKDGRPRGEQDEKGWRVIERVHRVTGIESTGYQKLSEALLVEDLESIGDEHPQIGDMFAIRRSPAAIDDSTVDITVTYERKAEAGYRKIIKISAREDLDNPAYADIEVGTVARQAQTNREFDGKLITVEYDGKTQSGTVTTDVGITTIVYKRTESEMPLDKSAAYAGRINSQVWALRPLDGKYTWKCGAITGRSPDGGQTWEVIYRFEYNPDTWDDQEVVYTDPSTGKTPDGLLNGSAAVKDLGMYYPFVNDQIDFNGLNL